MATKQRKQHDHSKGITHRLEHQLVLHRPTNRLPTTPTHRNLLRSPTQEGGQIMELKSVASPIQIEALVIRNARQAGVQRGINASIQALEELRSRHNKRSSGYNDLSLAITKLQALTIDQVEG